MKIKLNTRHLTNLVLAVTEDLYVISKQKEINPLISDDLISDIHDLLILLNEILENPTSSDIRLKTIKGLATVTAIMEPKKLESIQKLIKYLCQIEKSTNSTKNV